LFVVYDVQMIRIGALLLCLLLVLGCRPRLGTQAEWQRWFDTAIAQLPKWDTPILPSSDTPVVRTDDHLTLRLVHGYRKRNDFCWDKGKLPVWTTAWRDICVHRFDPVVHVRPEFFLKPQPLDPHMSDQYQSEDWEVGAVTIGGHRAIVERARVSGGFEGARRERRTMVFLEFRRGEWALLDGSAGDDTGYSELLGISGTIEPS